MATDRKRQIVAGVLLVILTLVLFRAWTTLNTESAVPSSSSNGRARASRSGRAATMPATAPDVHLRALDEERPKPMLGKRNLFRFRPKAAPPRPPRVVEPPPVVSNEPSVPTGPPAPPAIPLKFIGIVEAPDHAKRIAALVDSTGRSYHGVEGAVVAGQYRILKIGVESIEIAYLDGRGRQTLRLSGS